MAAPLYEAFMGKPAPPVIRCPDCKNEFPDEGKLHDHLGAQMAKGNGHIHCKECKKYFVEVDDLIAHVKATHIKPTDLVCPGCLRHHYSVGDMALHIERGECPTISMKKLEEVRERKLKFAKELQKRHRGAYDDPDSHRPTATGSHLRPKAEATVRPNPIQFLTHEHGPLGADLPTYYGELTPEKPVNHNGSSPAQKMQAIKNKGSYKVSLLEDFEPAKHSDLPMSLTEILTKGDDGLYTNPWTDAISPRDPHWVDIEPLSAPRASYPGDAKPAAVTPEQKPKAVQVFTMVPKLNTPWKTGLTGGDTSPTSFAALHDPKKPGWNIKKYMHPLYLQYKCPLPKCFKMFKKTGQFRNHLEWHLQPNPCEYQCPSCKKMFTCLSSLLFHTESKSQRCHYRDSPTYNIFLNQALGGLVDVVDEHGLGSERVLEFAVPEQAYEDFGPSGRAGRPTEKKMVTAAWEGNQRNGQERSPVRNINVLTDDVKVKIEYDEYKIVGVDIDDAFKNLPELGDKVAPEPEVKVEARKQVKFETHDQLVSFNEDAPTRVNSDDGVKSEDGVYVKSEVKIQEQTKKSAVVEDHLLVKPVSDGECHVVQDIKVTGNNIKDAGGGLKKQVEDFEDDGYGLKPLRNREFAEDNLGSSRGRFATTDFEIDGRMYQPEDYIVEWCDGQPLFYPRDPDKYKPSWNPINR